MDKFMTLHVIDGSKIDLEEDEPQLCHDPKIYLKKRTKMYFLLYSCNT